MVLEFGMVYPATVPHETEKDMAATSPFIPIDIIVFSSGKKVQEYLLAATLQ
jgi:hypothetical protein